MNPNDTDLLENAMKSLSWWSEPAPGLWREALKHCSTGPVSPSRAVSALRTRWPWIAAPLAAMIGIALVVHQHRDTSTTVSTATPDVGTGLVRSDRSPERAAVDLKEDFTGQGDRLEDSTTPTGRYQVPGPAEWFEQDALTSEAAGTAAAEPSIFAADTLFREAAANYDHRVSYYAVAASGPAAVPDGMPRQPRPETTSTQRQFRIPKGKYTAIIVGAHGTAPMPPTLIVIEHQGEKFPVSAGPGTTYFISFSEGWEVKDTEARVTISSVSTAGCPTASAAGFAWGLTATGPASFPEIGKSAGAIDRAD